MCSSSLWTGRVEARESQAISTDNGFISLIGQRYHCIPQGVDKERVKKSSLKCKSRWQFPHTDFLLPACLLSALKETRMKKKKKKSRWGDFSFLGNWTSQTQKLNPAARRPSVLLVFFPSTFIVFLPRF